MQQINEQRILNPNSLIHIEIKPVTRYHIYDQETFILYQIVALAKQQI